MKLISMTDFVLKQSESIKSDIIGYGEFIDKVVNYAKFLKQPLTLGMFVPCDESGNVLGEPVYPNTKSLAIDWLHEQYRHKQVIYQQAKERVLFEYIKAFDIFDKSDMENQTIEDLITDDYTYILTPYALKQIGL